MERVEFKNSQGNVLVGAYYAPKKETDKVIIVSHGFTANKERERLVHLSEALSELEVGVLRFDYRGSGESERAPITVAGLTDDLRSAISYLQNQGYKNFGLMGESLGGLTSLEVHDENIKAMVLWAPVTKAKTPGLFGQNKDEIEAKGYVKHYKERDDTEFTILAQYFDERQQVNTKKLLGSISCPVLIFHGTADDTLPLSDSQEAMSYLPSSSRLEIVKGGDHKLDAFQEEIIPKTVAWFEKYLVE